MPWKALISTHRSPSSLAARRVAVRAAVPVAPLPAVALRQFSLFAPMVQSCVGAAAAAPRLAAVAAVPSSTPVPGVRFISVKRRRNTKMNKHKHEKLKKRMRRLTAKNLKGNAK